MVGAIVGGIATLAPIVKDAANQPNAKDPQRFSEAQQWYQAALAGDADAECSLKYHSGQYGCASCGRFGQVCGHATDAAKTYDATLYAQLTKVKLGLLPASTPIPNPPGQTGNQTVTNIANTASAISDVTGAIATGLGKPSTPLGSPSQTRDRLETGGMILLVVAVVIGVVLVVKHNRS